MMKYLKKKRISKEWQNNLKTYFGLLFCVPISSAVAGKANRTLLQLLNCARILGNCNSEKDYFLESIFMYSDLNCCPDNPVRTQYRSYFNRFFPP